ncbi:hypothetical protein V8E51_001245 [Hyaloscypha variabilis]
MRFAAVRCCCTALRQRAFGSCASGASGKGAQHLVVGFARHRQISYPHERISPPLISRLGACARTSHRARFPFSAFRVTAFFQNLVGVHVSGHYSCSLMVPRWMFPGVCDSAVTQPLASQATHEAAPCFLHDLVEASTKVTLLAFSSITGFTIPTTASRGARVFSCSWFTTPIDEVNFIIQNYSQQCHITPSYPCCCRSSKASNASTSRQAASLQYSAVHGSL